MSNNKITAESLAAIKALVAQSQAVKPKKALDPAVQAAREAAKAERLAKRAEAKLLRDAARAERKAAREAAKANASATPAYTRRLEKLEGRLPTMTEAASEVFGLAKDLTSADLSVLSAHISYEIRRRGLTQAVSAPAQTFKVGDAVTIRECSHNPKFNGLTGIVKEARRIRAFVQVPGFETPAYCFISELEPTAVETIESSETSESVAQAV